jgi:hypothetical protein
MRCLRIKESKRTKKLGRACNNCYKERRGDEAWQIGNTVGKWGSEEC